MYLNYYCYYCYRCYIYYSSQSKLNYTNNDDCGTVAADQYTSVLTSMLWILRTCRVLEPRVCMLSDVFSALLSASLKIYMYMYRIHFFVQPMAPVWNSLPPSIVDFSSFARCRGSLNNVNLSIFTPF